MKSVAFVLLENKGWMVTGDWPRSRYELCVKESGFGKNSSCRRLRERWGRTRGSIFEEASFFFFHNFNELCCVIPSILPFLVIAINPVRAADVPAI
jgi:hypothetical protein